MTRAIFVVLFLSLAGCDIGKPPSEMARLQERMDSRAGLEKMGYPRVGFLPSNELACMMVPAFTPSETEWNACVREQRYTPRRALMAGLATP